MPFAHGSAALTAAARRQLDELGAALAGEKLRRFEVGVHGHTDASPEFTASFALPRLNRHEFNHAE